VISFVAALLTAIACRLVDRYTPPGRRRPPSLTRRQPASHGRNRKRWKNP
jgi:hypothetical protein